MTDIGNSEVPYNPTIIQKESEQRPFTPTLIESLYFKGEQFFKSGFSAVNGSTTVYTVPQGYILFIVSIYGGVSEANTPTIAHMYIETLQGGVTKDILLEVETNASAAGDRGTGVFGNLNPHYPIMIEENILINFRRSGSVGGLYCYYGIQGFLVKKDTIPFI